MCRVALTLEPLESRELLSASPWQNPVNPLDVYGTGTVTPLDALAIINALSNNGGSFKLSQSAGGTTPLVASPTGSSTPAPVTATDPQGLYLDVLGTGEVTPQDALQVINALSVQPLASSLGLNVTLQAQDASGNVLTSVTAGESFTLVALVKDTRGTPYGVFEAYTDVSYNSSLATISPNAIFNYGSDFSQGASGTTSTPGVIEDAGAYDPNLTYPANRTVAEDPGGTYMLWQVPVTVPASATPGTLTFTPSSANGDDSPFFFTNLYNSTDPEPLADIDYVPAVLTVNGVQTPPAFSIAPAQATDSTAGSTTMSFNVSLSQAPSGTVTVTAQTQDGTGSAAAKAGTDYTANQQTFTFTPTGPLTQTFTVSIAKATQIQVDKTFQVNLTSPTGVSVLGTEDQAVGTILNGDFPTLTIANATVAEGTSGTAPVVFTATLSQPSTQTITVDYAAQDGSGSTGAKVNTNYEYTAGTLTFLPGQTTAQVSVPITSVANATGTPPTLSFYLNLFSPVHVNLAQTTATGTMALTSPSTYSGYVFIDPQAGTNPTDAAARTSNDTPLQGVILLLTGTSSITNFAVNLQTYTASDGSYSFANLSPGTYVITEQIPPGFVGPEAVAGGAVVGTNTISFTIPLLGGVTGTNNNFAFSGIAAGGISQRSYLSSTPTGEPIIVSYNTVQPATVSPSVSPAVTPAVIPAAMSASPSGNAATGSSRDLDEELLLAIDSAFSDF